MVADMAQDRAAVRVICWDASGKVLLLRWRDPVGDRTFWEPPGGGVEDGETPLQAARRELHEETGLPGSAVLDVSVPVKRDFRWLGTHFVTVEPFYLARFSGPPEVAPADPTPIEADTYSGYGWFTLDELAELSPVEPPHLLTALAELGIRSE
jgi:8-oxo-dGTP diphosphatase